MAKARRMRPISKVIGAAMLIVLGTAFQAHALAITPTLATDSGPETSQKAINAILLAEWGIVGPELYKSDVDGGVESGALTGSYMTTYIPPTDPSGADIEYTGGSVVSGNPIYLLVKGGNHDPAWFLFNLTTITGGPWNGTETLYLRDFWPANGAISHVSLYGTTSTRVPDGGMTLGLLSSALLGLGLLRRKLSS